MQRRPAYLTWRGHLGGWRTQVDTYHSELDVANVRSMGVAATRPQNLQEAVLDAPGTRGRHLLSWARVQPQATADELDVKAHQLLELPRIATRVAPMLGLIATMIPMGPALKGLSDGNLGQVSDNLAVAFAAVILALIAAAITFWVVSVQRRWLAEDLVWLQRQAVSAATGASLSAQQGQA